MASRQKVANLNFNAWIHGTTAVAVMAVLFNIFQIIIIVKKQRRRGWKNPSSILLLSLSCADMLTGLVIAVNDIAYIILKSIRPDRETYKLWILIFKLIICYSLLNSLLHLIVLTAERLCAIRYPLKHLMMMATNTNIAKVITSIWVISLISFVNILKNSTLPFFMALSVLILLTGVFLAVVYFYIFRKFQTLGNQQRKSVCINISSDDSEHRMEIHMTIYNREVRSAVYCAFVVIVYVICSFPLAINTLTQSLSSPTLFTFISLSLMVVNSVCNPLLYLLKHQCISRVYEEMSEASYTRHSFGGSFSSF